MIERYCNDLQCFTRTSATPLDSWTVVRKSIYPITFRKVEILIFTLWNLASQPQTSLWHVHCSVHQHWDIITKVRCKKTFCIPKRIQACLRGQVDHTIYQISMWKSIYWLIRKFCTHVCANSHINCLILDFCIF